MKDLEKRFLITSLLAISFILVSITGVILTFFKLSRENHELIKQIHLITGFIMILLVIIHFYLNWKLFKNEGKAFFK